MYRKFSYNKFGLRITYFIFYKKKLKKKYILTYPNPENLKNCVPYNHIKSATVAGLLWSSSVPIAHLFFKVLFDEWNLCTAKKNEKKILMVKVCRELIRRSSKNKTFINLELWFRRLLWATNMLYQEEYKLTITNPHYLSAYLSRPKCSSSVLKKNLFQCENCANTVLRYQITWQYDFRTGTKS